MDDNLHQKYMAAATAITTLVAGTIRVTRDPWQNGADGTWITGIEDWTIWINQGKVSIEIRHNDDNPEQAWATATSKTVQAHRWSEPGWQVLGRGNRVAAQTIDEAVTKAIMLGLIEPLASPAGLAPVTFRDGIPPTDEYQWKCLSCGYTAIEEEFVPGYGPAPHTCPECGSITTDPV